MQNDVGYIDTFLKWIKAILITTAFISSITAFADCAISPKSKVVLLKLDDVVGDRTPGGSGVSAKWQRVTDFLEGNKIPASFGVIGDSLESDNPAYFAWLKQRVAVGDIELWNHGYISSFKQNKEAGELGEFNGTSAEKQALSLQQTQGLGKKRIGLAFSGFGPHNSAVDSSTYTQIDTFPELHYVWFYKPVDASQHHQFVFERVAELEAPIFHPNFEAFLKTYQKRPTALGYIAIQGHPNMWDDQGYESFVRVVHFLQAEGSTFCRPSEVLAANK